MRRRTLLLAHLVFACRPGVSSAPDERSLAGPTAGPVAPNGAPPLEMSASAGAAPGGGPLPAPLHRTVENTCGRDVGTGSTLQSFRLKTVDGLEVAPERFRNRVMVVNFWGTWCKPCREELPEFDRLYRRYREHGMTLVAIATDEDPKPVRAFIHRRRIQAPVLLGGEDYASQYGASNFPFTYVVDPSGIIVASYQGYKEECLGALESDIRKALQRRNAT